MPPARRSFAATGALACAAVALWISRGALAFEGADARTGYVGVLPSAWWLVALLAVAMTVAFVARPPVRAVLPLWLSAVLVLPWLPLPLSLSAFLWTGAVKAWLWTAIVAALGAVALEARCRRARPTSWTPQHAAIAAGVLSALAYGFGAWALSAQHPGGDEPHYLVITQSLIQDHDLRIENNHQQGDYSRYYDGPLKPDFLRRGSNGEIYSIHAPGLPLLVAPVFALFGYPGVITLLVTASAFGGGLAWFVAWLVTRDRLASWFGWAAVSLSAPFFLHASAVYPDGIGATIVLAASLPLIEPRARRPRYLLAIGSALAFLPWIHTRFAVLAAGAALVIAGRILTDDHDRPKRLVAFAVVPLISVLAWASYFWIIYGVVDPSAPYGGATNTSVANIVRGIPGLLFDQQFGLLPNAPVFLCALLGMGTMLWRSTERRLAAELLVITVPYFLVVAFFYMWWGGFSAPARFLVPLTLLLTVPTTAWFSTRQTTAARVAGAAALFVSMAVTVSMSAAEGGALSVNGRDGASRLLTWLSPVVDLTTALPSLFQNPPTLVIQHAALWLLAIGVATATAVIADRRLFAKDHLGRFSAAVLVFGLVAEGTTMAAASLVWASNHATIAKPDQGAWTLLRQYEPQSQQLAVAYQPFRRLRLREVPQHVLLARPIPGADGEWATMRHLPPGTYEISGHLSGPGEGLVRVVMDSESSPVAQWPVALLAPMWTTRFTIPVGVAALGINLDAAAKRTVRDISVRAVSVLPRRDRLPGNPEARSLARYGPAVVFLLSGSAWVEPAGTWIAGGGHAEFAIDPDAGRPIHLLVRNGATENQATLESGAWTLRLALRPGEERLVDLPPTVTRAMTPLRVQSAAGFRPALVDPKSQDQRFLGVWIETR